MQLAIRFSGLRQKIASKSTVEISYLLNQDTKQGNKGEMIVLVDASHLRADSERQAVRLSSRTGHPLTRHKPKNVRVTV